MSTQTETETGGEIDRDVVEACAEALWVHCMRPDDRTPEHCRTFAARPETIKDNYRAKARAVVEAYRRQTRDRGVVEVRAEDLEAVRAVFATLGARAIPVIDPIDDALAALVAADGAGKER